MIGDELAIEQGEAPGPQPRDKMRERDLRGVAFAAEHALAEKSPAKSDAIEAADQPAFVPGLDRMSMSAPVQIGIGDLDRRIDPGIGAIGGAGGAFGYDLGESLVGGDRESIGTNRLGQRARQLKPIKRENPALLGFDPIDIVGRAAVGHREHPDRISSQQQIRIDRLHRFTPSARL